MMRLTVNGVHYRLDDNLNRHIQDKIGNLDGYMSVHVKKNAHADVKLIGPSGRGKRSYTCEVIMHLPHEVTAFHASSINIPAAVNEVADKLKNHLRRYKYKHHVLRSREAIRRTLGKVRRNRR